MGSWFQKGENGTSKKDRMRTWLILVGAVLGIGLLLVGGRTKAEGKPESTETSSNANEETVIYRKRMEEEIRTLCESVSGVGEVRVAITLEGGFREIYATEGTDGKYVIVGSGSSATPLLISRDPPALVGIGIVCRGGSSPSVQHELVSLLSAAFDLPSNRIYVTEAK